MARNSSYWVKGFLLFFLTFIPLSSLAQSEKKFLNVDQLVGEALQNNPEILAAWRNRDTHLNMIRHQMAFQNLVLFLPSQGMKNFIHVASCPHKKGFPFLLGDKYHMVFAIPFRIG
jgi:hypothetical protein